MYFYIYIYCVNFLLNYTLLVSDILYFNIFVAEFLFGWHSLNFYSSGSESDDWLCFSKILSSIDHSLVFILLRSWNQVVYINGRPFVLRDVERPFSNLEYTVLIHFDISCSLCGRYSWGYYVLVLSWCIVICDTQHFGINLIQLNRAHWCFNWNSSGF